jgi:hypothetical protein
MPLRRRELPLLWRASSRIRLCNYTSAIPSETRIPGFTAERLNIAIEPCRTRSLRRRSGLLSPRLGKRRQFPNEVESIVPAGSALQGVNAGRALEQGLPIGLCESRPLWTAREKLTAQSQSLLPVAVGQQTVVADPHEAVWQDVQKAAN